MADRVIDAFHAALLDDDPVALYDRAPCGYLSTLADGTIVKVNETFLALSGYSRDALVGRRQFAELLTVGGRIYHETHYMPLLQMHGAVREVALDLVREDGRRLPVLVNSALERGEDGTPTIVRTAVFDATHRREYERELLRAKERAEASEARATLLARTLQQTLIPPTPPDIPELDVAAIFRPAGDGAQVGGDFYDVFAVGPGDWVVTVGDVCGKGVDAAIVTALARHTIRAAAVAQRRPSEVLTTLNEVLLRDATDRFCTVVVARLHHGSDGWTAMICCGGHPPPLHCRPGRGPVALRPTGALLGVYAGVRLTDTVLELRPGDALVLYTDGVTEARRAGDFFGEDRLRASLVGSPRSAGSLAHDLLGAVLAFQEGPPADDIAILALAVPPS
jgi:sigma-B regulation protein RsbU (phosphoserine phosphatase)